MMCFVSSSFTVLRSQTYFLALKGACIYVYTYVHAGWYPRLNHVLVVCAHSDMQWSGIVHYYCKYIRVCVSLEAAIISMYVHARMYVYVHKYFTCMHVCISILPCKHTLIDKSYYAYIVQCVSMYLAHTCTYKTYHHHSPLSIRTFKYKYCYKINYNYNLSWNYLHIMTKVLNIIYLKLIINIKYIVDFKCCVCTFTSGFSTY